MNVNVEHDFHMVGGEGEISYAKNSRVQVTTHLSPSLTPPPPPPRLVCQQLACK